MNTMPKLKDVTITTETDNLLLNSQRLAELVGEFVTDWRDVKQGKEGAGGGRARVQDEAGRDTEYLSAINRHISQAIEELENLMVRWGGEWRSIPRTEYSSALKRCFGERLPGDARDVR